MNWENPLYVMGLIAILLLMIIVWLCTLISLRPAKQFFELLVKERLQKSFNVSRTHLKNLSFFFAIFLYMLLNKNKGFNNEQEYETDLHALINNQVSIFNLGIDTIKGISIPINKECNFIMESYKHDKQNRLDTTGLHRETLKIIGNHGKISSNQIDLDNYESNAILSTVETRMVHYFY